MRKLETPGRKGRWQSGIVSLAVLLVCSICAGTPLAADPQNRAKVATSPQGIAPDMREEPPPATASHGSFMVVPIPFSNPTLDSGLVAAAAWFWPQDERQKATQPPSVTGLAAMYSSNGSRAAAIGHAAYWKEDRWRFKGAFGVADLELPLLAADDSGAGLQIGWNLDGSVAYAELSRRVGGNWYMGFNARHIDMTQSFSVDTATGALDTGDHLRSAGVGALLSFDTRDMPSNAYKGQYFEARAMSNLTSLGSSRSYQGYELEYHRYDSLGEGFVLAWDAYGCYRSGKVPMWDACRIGLRGFAATDYLGTATTRAQVEGRWRLGKRWGAVAFAGAGWLNESFSGLRDEDTIPSYGIGIRFMVQKPNRINLRLDYGRSHDSSAVILSVMEAF